MTTLHDLIPATIRNAPATGSRRPRHLGELLGIPHEWGRTAVEQGSPVRDRARRVAARDGALPAVRRPREGVRGARRIERAQARAAALGSALDRDDLNSFDLHMRPTHTTIERPRQVRGRSMVGGVARLRAAAPAAEDRGEVAAVNGAVVVEVGIELTPSA